MEQAQLEIIIEKCKQGDKLAFTKLISMFQKTVFSISFRLLCDEEDAKDVVQETFIKLWTNLNQYDASLKFSTWLYSIASHICLDKLKSFHHKNRQRIHADEVRMREFISEENTDVPLNNSELRKIIEIATDSLSHKQKLLFTLRYLEELEIPEIEQITGMTANQIKSNLYLARKEIQNKLKKWL